MKNKIAGNSKLTSPSPPGIAGVRDFTFARSKAKNEPEAEFFGQPRIEGLNLKIVEHLTTILYVFYKNKFILNI